MKVAAKTAIAVWSPRSPSRARTIRGENCPIANCTATSVTVSTIEVSVTTPVAIDRSSAVARTFGARDGLVALVRPDGYLGYRGRPDQAGELASYLARVFAMRLRELDEEQPGD